MSLSQYLAELKKTRLLEPQEEVSLWQGYKEQGSLACRQQIIESYQPLVFKAAMHWRGAEGMMMDLVQEGTVGLIEAVENYDHGRGVAFSLYASHRIRGRILNYIEREGRLNWTYMDEPSLSDKNLGTLGECLVDQKVGVSDQAEHNYLVEQVKTALGRLPTKEQMVLSGVYLQECDPKQLATELNMSISHIYRLQKQGIRRIRGMLSKFMQHW